VLAAESSARFSTKIIELNLLAPLSVSTHGERGDATAGRRRSIVNITSFSGRRPPPGPPRLRRGAKAGMESITAHLPSNAAPKVRVNSVVVGMVETEQSELF